MYLLKKYVKTYKSEETYLLTCTFMVPVGSSVMLELFLLYTAITWLHTLGKVNTKIVLINWCHFSVVDKHSVDQLRASPTSHQHTGDPEAGQTFWSWSGPKLNSINFDIISFDRKSLVNRHIHRWKTEDRTRNNNCQVLHHFRRRLPRLDEQL